MTEHWSRIPAIALAVLIALICTGRASPLIAQEKASLKYWAISDPRIVGSGGISYGDVPSESTADISLVQCPGGRDAPTIATKRRYMKEEKSCPNSGGDPPVWSHVANGIIISIDGNHVIVAAGEHRIIARKEALGEPTLVVKNAKVRIIDNLDIPLKSANEFQERLKAFVKSTEKSGPISTNSEFRVILDAQKQ